MRSPSEMAGIGCPLCAYSFESGLLARDVAARMTDAKRREADDELAAHRAAAAG